MNRNHTVRGFKSELRALRLAASKAEQNAHQKVFLNRAIENLAQRAAALSGKLPSDDCPFENEERMIEFILSNIPKKHHKAFLRTFNEQKTADASP